MYKFMPINNLSIGLDDWELLDPSFYGELCKAAIADIEQVFPDAAIGVVGGDRREHCGWNVEVENEITSGSDAVDFDAWVYHYYSPYQGPVGSAGSYLDQAYEEYVSSTLLGLAAIQDSDQLNGQAPSKPVWYTEFNVLLDGNEFPGSWLDLMGKFKLINQYWATSQDFKDALDNALPLIQNAYNLGSPPMEIEMMLMHTLLSNGQSALSPIFNPADSLLDFQFLDQGLIGTIIDRSTRDDYDIMTPILFRNETNSGLVADDLISHSGTVPGSSPLCNSDSTVVAAETKVWGWMFQDQNSTDLDDFKQLIVNGSNECVILGGIQAYDPDNVDIFMFDPPSDTNTPLPQLNMNGDLLRFIQEVDEGGVVDTLTGFCFHTGDLNGVDDVDLLVGGNIVLPPYSVLLLEGDIYQEECGGLISTFFDIPPPPTYTISNGVTTWTDEDYQVLSDIIIEDGGSLIIDGGSLMMAPGVDITISPNAVLELTNGALLTSCGETWNGIYVMGDPSGQDVMPGRLTVKNDAILEHASTAIRNYKTVTINGFKTTVSGGLIQIENAVLRNNKLDVEFKSYQNHTNAVLDNDQSYFALSDFYVDDEYRFASQSVRSMLFTSCNGMRIQGCEFSDLRHDSLLIQERRQGVKLVNATMRMKNFCGSVNPGVSCNYIPTRFLNMSQGVLSTGQANPAFNTYIKNSYFDCWNGVMLQNTLGDVIWNNEFQVSAPFIESGLYTPPTSYPVGLYLSTGVDDYAIEGNYFHENPNDIVVVDENAPTYGIGAFTNNASDELIYRNTMQNLYIGFQSINKNRANGQFITGLELHCNTFSGNAYDISVMEVGNNVPNAGIKSNQGNTNAPTLNAFEVTTVPTVTIQNEVGDLNYSITYFYETGGVDALPYSNVGLVTPDDELNSLGVTCDNTTSLEGGNEFASLTDSTNESDQNMTSTKLLLDQMVDGGNTQQLQNVVTLSQSGDEWQSYLTLMNEAGYVSDPVLEILSSKEEGFTLAQIRDVLVANSHSASNTAVDSILNARSQQLPQYMRDQIKQGLQDISPLQFLQNQLGQYKSTKDRCIRRMALLRSSDSLTVTNPPSLESIYAMGDGPEWKYKLLELYHHQGRSLQYDSLKAVMESEISSQDLTELERYSELRSLTIAWAALDSLPPGTYDTLYTYLENKDAASAWAKSILIGVDSLELDEPLLIPNDQNKRLGHLIDKSPYESNEGILELFPNPAQDFLTISYRIDKAFKNGECVIYNVLGQDLWHRKLSSPQDQLIEEHGLEPGHYVMSLIVDEEVYRATPLIIID